jgi:hypothetical protein
MAMKPKDLSEAVGLTKRFERIVSLRELLQGGQINRSTVQTVLGELHEDISNAACQQMADILEMELHQIAVRYREELAKLGMDVTELKLPPSKCR